MDVLISITGVQSAGGESDTVELTTEGLMEPLDDGWLLRYEESEATGMAGVTTELRVGRSGVVLERTGAMSSLLVLEKGKRHLCRYETGYGPLMLGIYTKEIDNRLKDDGGELYFHYTMDVGQGEPYLHDVRLTVRQTASA